MRFKCVAGCFHVPPEDLAVAPENMTADWTAMQVDCVQNAVGKRHLLRRFPAIGKPLPERGDDFFSNFHARQPNVSHAQLRGQFRVPKPWSFKFTLLKAARLPGRSRAATAAAWSWAADSSSRVVSVIHQTDSNAVTRKQRRTSYVLVAFAYRNCHAASYFAHNDHRRAGPRTW